MEAKRRHGGMRSRPLASLVAAARGLVAFGGGGFSDDGVEICFFFFFLIAVLWVLSQDVGFFFGVGFCGVCFGVAGVLFSGFC